MESSYKIGNFLSGISQRYYYMRLLLLRSWPNIETGPGGRPRDNSYIYLLLFGTRVSMHLTDVISVTLSKNCSSLINVHQKETLLAVSTNNPTDSLPLCQLIRYPVPSRRSSWLDDCTPPTRARPSLHPITVPTGG